jgi:hypothetical protein
MAKRKGIDSENILRVSREVSNVSKQLGLKLSTTEKIVSSQFDFIKYVIQRGDFETVRLPYLGKFEVSPKRLYHYNLKDGITENRKRVSRTRQSGSEPSEGVQKDNNQGQGQE